MGQVIYILAILIIPVLVAYKAGGKQQGVSFAVIILTFGIIFLLLLVPLNVAMPFGSGGDDVYYYRASLIRLSGITDWVDFSQFPQYEQAGFALLLTWIGQITGDSLYHRKAINVLFYLLLAITWFKIGKIVIGERQAKLFGLFILLALPLWYHWIFLLKDMVIIYLQSLFLSSLVYLLFTNVKHVSTYIKMVIVTLLLIPFRVQLVAVNALLFLVAGNLQLFTPLSSKTRKFILVITVILFFLFLDMLLEVDFIETMGARGRLRSYDIQTIILITEHSGILLVERSIGSYILMPLNFIVITLNGFWNILTPPIAKSIVAYKEHEHVFGLLCIPWALYGAPLAIAGILMSMRFKIKKAMNTDAVNYWIPMYVFTILYFVIYILVQSSRWIMPVYPVLVALSCYGWIKMQASKKIMFLSGSGALMLIMILMLFLRSR